MQLHHKLRAFSPGSGCVGGKVNLFYSHPAPSRPLVGPGAARRVRYGAGGESTLLCS